MGIESKFIKDPSKHQRRSTRLIYNHAKREDKDQADVQSEVEPIAPDPMWVKVKRKRERLSIQKLKGIFNHYRTAVDLLNMYRLAFYQQQLLIETQLKVPPARTEDVFRMNDLRKMLVEMGDTERELAELHYIETQLMAEMEVLLDPNQSEMFRYLDMQATRNEIAIIQEFLKTHPLKMKLGYFAVN